MVTRLNYLLFSGIRMTWFWFTIWGNHAHTAHYGLMDLTVHSISQKSRQDLLLFHLTLLMFRRNLHYPAAGNSGCIQDMTHLLSKIWVTKPIKVITGREFLYSTKTKTEKFRVWQKTFLDQVIFTARFFISST